MLLVVAAALIDDEGRVLLAQRPEGKHLAGTWEFPGGKVDAGEAPESGTPALSPCQSHGGTARRAGLGAGCRGCALGGGSEGPLGMTKAWS